VFLQNVLLGAALTCLLQFAYHFPVQTASRHRETRLALYLGGLYTLWEAGYAVFRFAQLRAGHISCTVLPGAITRYCCSCYGRRWISSAKCAPYPLTAA
jgi:hypothetical protein